MPTVGGSSGGGSLELLASQYSSSGEETSDPTGSRGDSMTHTLTIPDTILGIYCITYTCMHSINVHIYFV